MPEQPRHCIVAIVPCNDIDASTAFYMRLGLSVHSDQGHYRILSDGMGWLIHLSAESPEDWVVRDRNPNGLYLYLEDVDGLACRVADLHDGITLSISLGACMSLPCPTPTELWCGSVGRAAAAMCFLRCRIWNGPPNKPIVSATSAQPTVRIRVRISSTTCSSGRVASIVTPLPGMASFV